MLPDAAGNPQVIYLDCDPPPAAAAASTPASGSAHRKGQKRSLPPAVAAAAAGGAAAAVGSAAGYDDEVQFVGESPPPSAQKKRKKSAQPEFRLTEVSWTNADDDAAAAELVAAAQLSDVYAGPPVARFSVESAPNARSKAREGCGRCSTFRAPPSSCHRGAPASGSAVR